MASIALRTRIDVGVGGLPVTTVHTATAAMVPKATISAAISRIINCSKLSSNTGIHIKLCSIAELQEEFDGDLR
tara:strand:- start:116 stop:337 length:222 start_codon:yes stop_codon:yes gene_type:complete